MSFFGGPDMPDVPSEEEIKRKDEDRRRKELAAGRDASLLQRQRQGRKSLVNPGLFIPD